MDGLIKEGRGVEGRERIDGGESGGRNSGCSPSEARHCGRVV